MAELTEYALTDRTIRNIESGAHRPHRATLEVLALVLRTSVDWLRFGEDCSADDHGEDH